MTFLLKKLKYVRLQKKKFDSDSKRRIIKDKKNWHLHYTSIFYLPEQETQVLDQEIQVLDQET